MIVYGTSKVSTLLEVVMRVGYDARTDTLTVIFKSGDVAESDEDRTGVILDYDADGNLLSLEVLDASKRVDEPNRVTFSNDS